MLAFLTSTGIETAKMVALASLLFGALMIAPCTRRTTMATIKFTNRHSPAWAKGAMVAAALIPGQADEILLVAVLLIPILRNAHKRRLFARTLEYAWKG